MRHLFGWVVAGGILLGLTVPAQAQVAVSVGTPFGAFNYGSGLYGGYGLGGYGGGYGLYAPTYGSSYYNSGYSGYVAPGTTMIQQSYGGLYPYGSYYNGYGYGPYSGYGIGSPYYGGYGYGVSRGFGIGGFGLRF